MNNIEKRYIELKSVSEDRMISGTAIIFNSEGNDMGGWKEIIEPTAITQELIERSDISMLYNHNDQNGVLARSRNGKGTLKIEVTETGVEFRFKAKKTNFGDEILSAVKEGDLSACSFAMRVANEGDKVERRSDNTLLRTITKVELLDEFSIVRKPVYEETSVRSIDQFNEKEAEEVKRTLDETQVKEFEELKAYKILKDKEEAEQKAIKLLEYTKNLKERISKID